MKRLAAAQQRVSVTRWQAGVSVGVQDDQVVTEAPLEIRLITRGQSQPFVTTMRTPGADFELIAGFLFSEGVIHHRHDIFQMRYCVAKDSPQHYNSVNVTLRPDVSELLARRPNGLVTSSCGVCGTASIALLEARGLTPISDTASVDPLVLTALPERLRANQPLFQATGGVHAAALFDYEGELKNAWEDVGRHNALDKLVGHELLQARLPLGDTILMLSGRASYELVHKAVAAGIAVVCAVSAPSSLAVEVARTFGVTLVAFFRGDQFTVYSHPERLAIGN